MDQREALIMLNMLPAFGMRKYEQLVKTFPKVEAVFEATRVELKERGFTDSLIKGIGRLKLFNPKDEIEKCRKEAVKIITYFDDEYPKILRQIYSPPLVLYFKGEHKEEDNLSIAVVGTRRPSIYGKTTAEKLSLELARRNITIVSGLARGIDTAAHLGALKGKGRTIAVMGSGLGYIYPSENIKLAKEISEKGVLISEFPYDAFPSPSHFPRRNRLISGLSLGTVVIEAGVKSGALITANFAIDEGKEVFALPGKIDSPTSEGTHRLIKEGAKLVVDVEDILEEFKYRFPQISTKTDQLADKKEVAISEAENRIFLFINRETDEGTHIDEIIRRSQVGPGKVASLLFNLELKGLIKQISGKRFIRT